MAAKAASKSIPPAERLKLWVRAGGRCEICNKYLLEDEFTLQPVSIAEIAHNVGRQQSPGSPRGTDDLSIEDRNKAGNLLLLCGDHHAVIDDLVAREEYTVNDLLELKATHEDRIKYLTELGEDAETVVLRVVGEIRGAAVELSQQAVRRAVRPANRYPRYDLAARGGDIELDLRRLPDEGTDAYWNEAKRQIDTTLTRIRDGVERNTIRHLSVFPFARIPLLVLLGRHLDDKIGVDLYQRRRDGDQGWHWDETATPITFVTTLTRAGAGERVALLVSISGTVDLNELPPEIDEQTTIYEIAPADDTAPGPAVLRSRRSLDEFEGTYRALLAEIERAHPGLAAIELFVAAPVTAAVVLGRARMTDVHPPLRVYDRNADGSYAFALEVA